MFVVIIFCLFTASSVFGGNTTKPAAKEQSATVIKTGTPAAKKTTPSAKPAMQKKTAENQKIQSFLVQLNKAGSMEEVAKVFSRSRFSSSELKILEQEIEKAEYKSKLERLKRKTAAKPKPANYTKTHRKRPPLKKVQADLKRSQELKITRLNQQVSRFTARFSSQTGARAAVSTSARRMPVPGIMAAGIPVPTSSVDIREVDPRPAIIGRRLTIRGVGFGSSQGAVSVVVGRPSNPDRQAFSCPIQSWNDRSIVITIPLDCEPLVALEDERFGGIGSEFAWIYINPAGDDPGGFEDIEVALDRDRFAPQITSINPEREISPGQLMLIRGTNLHIGRFRHAVVFIFGHERFEVDPERSGTDYIEVMLPDDIEGMTETPGTVRVTNMTGLTDDRDMTFIPLQEVVEIVSEDLKAHCSPSRPRIFCFVGNIHWHTLHDWTLINGWTVEDSWLEVYEHGLNSGAYYQHQPTEGSTMASSRLAVWADAYSRVTAIEHLRIKGPKGTRSH